MATIGTLAVNIVARTDKFVRGITKSQSMLGKFARGVGLAAKALATMGTAAIAAGGALLTYLVKSQFSAVDALAKTSDRLGIATEKLAGLTHAANIYGVSQEGMNKGITDMVRRIGEAVDGAGEAGPALKKLGLDANTLANMSADEAFIKIADGISKIPTQAEKASTAYKIFGRRGMDLVNLLQRSEGEIRGLMAEAEKLGLTVSREMAAKIEEANDAMARLRSAFTGLGRQLAVRVAPIIEKMATSLTELMTNEGRIHKFANVLAAAIGGAISGVLSGIHAIRKALADIEVVFRRLMLDFSSSQAAKVMGVNFDGDTMRRMGRGVQGAEFRQMQMDNAKDPGAEFLKWFNKHLDKAFNTNTPESKKSESIINKWAERYSKVGFEGIGRLLGQGSNQLKVLEMKAANGLKGLGGKLDDNRGSLAFARTGSADSYRQRAQIRRQSDPVFKVANEQLKVQKEIRDNLKKPDLAPANLG